MGTNIKTLDYFKNLFVSGYAPTKKDFLDLYDTVEALGESENDVKTKSILVKDLDSIPFNQDRVEIDLGIPEGYKVDNIKVKSYSPSVDRVDRVGCNFKLSTYSDELGDLYLEAFPTALYINSFYSYDTSINTVDCTEVTFKYSLVDIHNNIVELEETKTYSVSGNSVTVPSEDLKLISQIQSPGELGPVYYSLKLEIINLTVNGKVFDKSEYGLISTYYFYSTVGRIDYFSKYYPEGIYRSDYTDIKYHLDDFSNNIKFGDTAFYDNSKLVLHNLGFSYRYLDLVVEYSKESLISPSTNLTFKNTYYGGES